MKDCYEEKTCISAKEAKEISDTSLCTKNRVFKLIREAAKENRNEIYWDIYGVSEAAVEDLISVLKEKGYSVERVCSVDEETGEKEFEDNLIIKW